MNGSMPCASQVSALLTNKFELRLRRATFWAGKLLESFDFSRPPNLNRSLIHDLIVERYEPAATIVTSNLDFTEWDQALPAKRLLTAATLDRLRHNAYCLTLDGDSYRSPKLVPTAPKSAVQKQGEPHGVFLLVLTWCGIALSYCL